MRQSSGPSTRTASLAVPLVVLSLIRLILNSTERFLYPFLPAVARGLGIPLEQAGLLLSARAIGGFTTPFTVAVAGRGGRHRRLVVAALALFVAGAGAVVLPVGFAVTLAAFVVLGAARPAFDAAAQAYLAERTPYARRGRILAVLELTYAGGFLLGAPAAGWLIARGDWRSPFLAAIVSAVVAAGVALRTLEHRAHDAPHADPPLRLDRPAWILLAMLALLAAGTELTIVVLGAWLEGGFGLTLLALGGAATIIGLAELAGEVLPLAVADRIGKVRSVAGGLSIAIISFLALASVESLAGGLAAVAGALLGFEVAIVAAIPIASEIRPRARSRFLALGAVAMFAGRAVAAAIGPLVFLRAGMAGNALASAGIHALALALLLTGIREPAHDPDEVR